MGNIFYNFGNKPYEHASCAFCGENVQFEKDLIVEGITSKLGCHIKERHKVILMADILSKISLLPEDRRSQLIETLILKYGFRTHKYKLILAVINKEKKKESQEKESQKILDLEAKLGNILDDPSRAEKEQKRKRLFQCDICPYSGTSRLSDFRQHTRTHTGEKPFRCDVKESCPARFKTSGQISDHRRRWHTYEKRFSCNVCEKSFVAKVQLDKHSVIHNEVREKLIRCDLCEFCTDSRGNMRRHTNSHFPAPKTLECNDCAKLFGNKAHLERHHQIHNPSLKKKFNCEKCSHSFSERYNLKQHIDFVHNKILKFVCKECGKKLKNAVN